MKRVIALTLALLALFSLAACGQAENYSDWLILSHYKGHQMAGIGTGAPGGVKGAGAMQKACEMGKAV